jgi:hypothetical protein
MRDQARTIFSFPNPVNEYAARLVAGMVATLSLVIVVFDVPWLLLFLMYGFAARVLAGPTLSPIGLLATRLIVPLAGDPDKPVAGPPKRFAQTVGLVFSTSSLLLYFAAGSPLAAYSVLGVLIFFALLESVVGFCAGCFVFGYLMRWGVVPQRFCEDCQNFGFDRA